MLGTLFSTKYLNSEYSVLFKIILLLLTSQLIFPDISIIPLPLSITLVLTLLLKSNSSVSNENTTDLLILN